MELRASVIEYLHISDLQHALHLMCDCQKGSMSFGSMRHSFIPGIMMLEVLQVGLAVWH